MTTAVKKKSATKFLAAQEHSDVSRKAAVNVGRRLKRDGIKKGLNKSDRKFPRRKCNKPVKIGLAKARFWIDGTLKDLSTGGAMLELKNGLMVSHQLLVYDEEEGHIYPCGLVRNSIDRIGVRFIGKRLKVFPKSSKFFGYVSVDDARAMVTRRAKIAQQRRKIMEKAQAKMRLRLR